MADAALRVFFALWPDAPLRSALADLAGRVAREARGRPTAGESIHLTLAFLGAQRPDRVAMLRALAERVHGSPFAIMLDEIGCFQRSAIAWLGSSVAQAELVALQERLASALRERGFPVDDRRYAPHLTLARRIEAPVRRQLPEPIQWKVGSFALVASETGRGGPTYRTLAEWSLVLA
jgi:2'-5' RNA ligase